MATAAERRAYARKLNNISKQHQRLERDTLKASVQLLKDVRDRIAGQITGTEFNEFRIAQQTEQLNLIINEYDTQLRSLANGSVRQSFDLGERSVIEPLQELNMTGVFFKPSAAQVDILAQFSADLVGGVTDDLRRKVNRTIRLSALGGQSSIDAMKQITKDLGIPTRRSARAEGVSYEAERILRTETNRAYNLANFSQQEKIAEDIPGTKKRWMATGDGRTRPGHLEAHGQTVDIDKKFKLTDPKGSYELMYPGDPAGPAYGTINCRCRSITIPPDFDEVELPVDKQVEKEKAARGEVPTAKRPAPAAEKSKPKAKAELAKVTEIPGDKIGSFIDRPTSGKYAKKYNEAIESIESVHGVKGMQQTPLTTKKMASSYGEYRFSKEGNEIVIDPSGDKLTIVHELGHAIDHQSIAIPGAFDSQLGSIYMTEWKEAIRNTAAYQRLQDMKSNPGNYSVEVTLRGNIHTFAAPSTGKLNYLLDDREVWARSYSQYIAEKTQDPELLAGVAKRRGDELYGNQHWDSEDFAPVVEAIDTMFKRLGWAQ